MTQSHHAPRPRRGGADARDACRRPGAGPASIEAALRHAAFLRGATPDEVVANARADMRASLLAGAPAARPDAREAALDDAAAALRAMLRAEPAVLRALEAEAAHGGAETALIVPTPPPPSPEEEAARLRGLDRGYAAAGLRLREGPDFGGGPGRMAVDFPMGGHTVGRVFFPAEVLREPPFGAGLPEVLRRGRAEGAAEPEVVSAFLAWLDGAPECRLEVAELARRRLLALERAVAEADPRGLPSDPAEAEARLRAELAGAERAVEGPRARRARDEGWPRHYGATMLWSGPSRDAIAAENAAGDPTGARATGVADLLWDAAAGGFMLMACVTPRRAEAEAWLAWARGRYGGRPGVAFSPVRGHGR